VNCKTISLLVCALFALAAFMDYHKRLKDRETMDFLREKLAEVRYRPQHNPPVEREILAMAERDSVSFCYPADRTVDGCQLDAMLVGDEWTVFAWPYLGAPGKSYECCAPDSDRLFIYSRKGGLLTQERGGP
jgi:hypothetical protein